MHVQDPQCRYWMEFWDASFEVVRRRLAENDGEVAFRVIRSIIPPVAKARQRKSLKAYLSRISQRHIRVIQEYAAGKDLTEIVREEKSSRGTILRILRTAPFSLLECDRNHRALDRREPKLPRRVLPGRVGAQANADQSGFAPPISF